MEIYRCEVNKKNGKYGENYEETHEDQPGLVVVQGQPAPCTYFYR